ncbi:MAG: multidrug efflux SMR transporter [Burkholderiales bacterium]|jgi:quaternary ammonium compound-resistance protein SugE|nr:multidrug efflux SMR transporter [Burkholderiales bacterium]MCA3227693.1 multidrug efflux SMR transporter [Burkholderiales bacterium]
MSSLLNPSPTTAWALLLIAGLLEIAWAVGMKFTDGFTRPWPSLAVLGLALLSFWLLGLAMRVLPVGTAYAVWVGIGAAGAALIGMWLLDEPASAARLGCVLMIVGGVVGLKLLHE